VPWRIELVRGAPRAIRPPHETGKLLILRQQTSQCRTDWASGPCIPYRRLWAWC
jgi:hypothetical protein